MFTRTLGLLLVLCLCQLARSQATDAPPESLPVARGTFSDNTYTNDFLGFSYPLPVDWVLNPELGPLPPAPAKEKFSGSFLLLVADHRQPTGDFVNRIVLVADSERNFAPDFTADAYAQIFLRAAAKRDGSVEIRATPVEFAGTKFYRMDSRHSSNDADGYKAFVCAKFAGYWVSWTFVAFSPEELDNLVGSLDRLSIRTSATFSPLGAESGSAPPVNLAPPERRVRISQGVAQTLIRVMVQPAYPGAARSGRLQGAVVLRTEVSKEGDVTEVTLISGHRMLAPSAIEAVKLWKFKPYMLNGMPVAFETQVTINFTLQER